MIDAALVGAAAGPALACVWLAIGWLLHRAARQVRRLDQILAGRPAPSLDAAASSRRLRLSVVVAARDEAESIERTVRSLLAQRHIAIEVLVVDDRSTDGTGAILDQVAAGQPADPSTCLVMMHNHDLPDGWLGKCHACHLGATRATGDWILFMDGDVEMVSADLLARVVALADEDRIDHLALLPDTRPMSALQTALMAVFGHLYMLAARAWEIDQDRPRGGAGVGAFNLIRREVYDRVGGHRLLRMDPADDYKLGRLIKESGARQRIYDGVNLIRCPWHRGTLAVVRGLEKNMFAGLHYSPVLLVGLTILAGAALAGPIAAAGWGLVAAAREPGIVGAGRAALPAAGLAALAATGVAAQLLVVALAFVEQTRRAGGNPVLLMLLYPIGAALIILAAWNSAVLTLRHGGIRWRDTFYPLSALRRGIVPAGAGRRFAKS